MRLIRKPQIPLFFQWSQHKIGNELQKMSDILDRHPEFLIFAHADLTNSKKDTGTGGMSSEQVLRSAIIKNIRELSYEQPPGVWNVDQ